jgi:NADH-quinone oxidoreductase subunit L
VETVDDDVHGAHGGGHGHGAWHGPHESPTPMTLPLMVLAAGAIFVGMVGIPAALGGSNAIERFLEPSFTASEVRQNPEATNLTQPPAAARNEAATAEHEASPTSVWVERGLMVFSVLIAVAGILLAWKFYVTNPEISERLAQRWAVAHRTLSNKYYVDELYNATVVSGTMAGGRVLWTFDRNVVDGAVNASGRLTIVGSWLAGLTDRFVVDGAVNLIGLTIEESSYWFRRVQTGLLQNYAMLMVFGVFLFVGVYLLW